MITRGFVIMRLMPAINASISCMSTSRSSSMATTELQSRLEGLAATELYGCGFMQPPLLPPNPPTHAPRDPPKNP